LHDSIRVLYRAGAAIVAPWRGAGDWTIIQIDENHTACHAASEKDDAMKATLWYLLAGLEVWLGVLAILLGIYGMLAMVRTDSVSAAETLACISGIVLGVGLVVDAIQRELGERARKNMKRLGNPLDTPTRPGHA